MGLDLGSDVVICTLCVPEPGGNREDTRVSVGIEILVYVLTAALAVSAGLVLGWSPSTRYPRAGFTAGLLIIGVATIAGFILGSDAPWMGPIFALVCLTTGTLAAAVAKGEDPAYRGESFGTRVLAVLNVRRGVPLGD